MIKTEMLDSIRHVQKQERIRFIKFGIKNVRSSEKKKILEQKLKELTT